MKTTYLHQRTANGMTASICVLVCYIEDMNQLFSPKHPFHCGAGSWPREAVLSCPLVKIGMTPRRDELEEFAVVLRDIAEARIAQPHSLFEHRVEYRREVAGRRIDDPQHLGRRGLLFERLARLGNEARIFH